MAATNVDKVNGRTIRKLHSPDKAKCFGYISGIADERDNLSNVEQHANLTAARNFCGFENKVANDLTAPKSSYAQNQKGYDPHAKR